MIYSTKRALEIAEESLEFIRDFLLPSLKDETEGMSDIMDTYRDLWNRLNQESRSLHYDQGYPNTRTTRTFTISIDDKLVTKKRGTKQLGLFE